MWIGRADRFLFFSGRSRNVLNLDIGPDLIPFALEQLLLKLFQLGARRANKILPIAFSQSLQVVFADHTAVENPNASRSAVFAFDHSHHHFQRRDVGTVAIKGFVAERESVFINDQGNDDLRAACR
jgi:hypothetical protein